MNKVDVILEQFDMDPMGISIEPYYSQAMFEEGQQFLEDTVNSARTGVTKKNFISKIWDMIKKIWGWCCKQWTRFVNWIKKVFSRKNQKTADQVISDVIKTGTKPGSSETSKVNGSSGSVKIPTEMPKDGSIPSVKVELSVNPASEAPPQEPSIEALMKPINVAYQADQNSLSISIDYWNKAGSGEVHGQKEGNYAIANVVVLAEKPELLNMIRDALTSVKNGNLGDGFLNKMNEFWDAFDFTVKNNYQVPLSHLTVLAKNMNEIMELMNNINMNDNVNFSDKRVIEEFNDLSLWCAKVQMGINSFTKVIQSVYQIDASYIGSITTYETLDKFIKAMIDGAIPPKYIGYNTYLACSDSLKGTKGGTESPIWGQSRLVLFPDNMPNDVIKIALSGWGLQSNRSEHKTSEQLVRNGGSGYISVTKSIGPTGATTVAERVNPNGNSLTGNVIEKFLKNLYGFINAHQFPFVIGDLHGGNLGTKNNHVVAIDYAWADRRDASTPISI